MLKEGRKCIDGFWEGSKKRKKGRKEGDFWMKKPRQKSLGK